MVSHTQLSENVNINKPVVRGVTKGKGTYTIMKRTNNKLKVSIDTDYKKFVGVNASKFVNELDVHLKAEAPVEGVSGWGEINKSLKESIIKSSLDRFEIEGGIDDDVIKLIHETCRGLYTGWRYKAHLHYKETLAKGLNPYEYPFPAMGINDKLNERYTYMIDHVSNSDKFKKRSEINTKNRDKVKYNHIMGSRSYAATLHIEDEDNMQNEIDYIELFKSSYFNEKTGKWVNQQCEENYMKLKQLQDEAKEVGIEISIEDLFQQVFGKVFSYFGKKSSSARSNVRNKQDKEEVEKLKQILTDFTKTSEERYEAQQKIIEEQNKKIEEYKHSQFEFIRSILTLYPQSGNGSFSSLLNLGGEI